MIIILIARVTDRVMDNKVWKISGMDTETNKCEMTARRKYKEIYAQCRKWRNAFHT